MLRERYAAWVVDYVLKQNGHVRGKCLAATKEMHAAFPELLIRAGHVETPVGREAHWWLETPDGSVVDPTHSQFTGHGGILEYEAWAPGQEVRVGKCMDCGDEIWRPVITLNEEPKHETFCSKFCEQVYENYMDTGRA